MELSYNEDEYDDELLEPKFKYMSNNKDRCCFGCFSIRQGAFFVAISEIIALSLFIIETVYFVVKDGDVFYSKELVGRGDQVALVGFSLAIISAIAIALLIISAIKQNYYLLIPHLVWQAVVIVLMLWMVILLSERMGYEADPKVSIKVPSAITLMIFLIIPAALEIWWLIILSDFCWRLRQNRISQAAQLPELKIETTSLITQK